jgi:hypothetical protein
MGDYARVSKKGSSFKKKGKREKEYRRQNTEEDKAVMSDAKANSTTQ